MRFSELELKRLLAKGKNMTTDDEIAFNIINFIHCIQLNKQDFYKESFDSQIFGDIEMRFKKNTGSLIGYCKVVVKKENSVIMLYIEP